MLNNITLLLLRVCINVNYYFKKSTKNKKMYTTLIAIKLIS